MTINVGDTVTIDGKEGKVVKDFSQIHLPYPYLVDFGDEKEYFTLREIEKGAHE